MSLSTGYELATDAQFRELGNFSTPPRAGRITAIEGNGQVRVATDDPDGGDVLAWPLNGFTYAVNDVVYVAFAVNNPESAIVIGSKGTLPALDAGVLPEGYVPVDGSDPLTADWDIGENMAIKAERFEARDGEGLRLEDDGGNLGLFVADGGNVAIKRAVAGAALDVNGAFRAIGTGTVPSADGAGQSVELWYYTGAGGPYGLVLSFDRDAATYKPLRLAGDSIGFEEGTTRVMTIDNGGVGIGTTSPLGALHAMGSVGRLLFVEKSGIVGSSQTIIANGAGDVTRALFGWLVLNDGTSGVADSFTLLPGNNVDISVGGSTWRLALAANGALTVARQAGSGTASIALLMLWI